MERTKLNKDDKKILRLLEKYGQDALDTMPRSRVRRALRVLESHSLVKVAWLEGGDYEAVMLTRDGWDLLIENPRLHNPIDWKWIITTIIAAIAAVGTIAVIFISCVKH